MDTFWLEADQPLTKKYVRNKHILTKTPYPFTWEFTSHKRKVNTLSDFKSWLDHHAAKGHCLIKGQLQRDLIKESRAGSTSSSQPTEWICLDLDGVDAPSVQSLLDSMKLGDVSYILQYSASYGISDKLLRAHVFMLLEIPVTPPFLKQWLIHLNHTVPELTKGMKLTKTGNAISWPLDISACQNDKLIYIAPPVLQGMPDPLGSAPRISLVKRKLDKLSLPQGFSAEKNKVLTQRKIADLRDQDGLPKRKLTTKMHGSTEILVKPDVSLITDMKTERGFVYFNLNGGDSWAYYHPENNPEYVHNFKGEPTYLTKELLPDYWEQITNSATKVSSNGMTYLAFCDRKSSTYYRGTYDSKLDLLDIYPAKNETQLRHFAKQHGMPMGDFIPEWDLVFDPQDPVRVDIQNQVVNIYQPSEFMKATNLKAVTKIPPNIFKIINHVLGGDPEIVEHFINWLAYIVQQRDRTKTAWVLHGVPGTGKGILATQILRPIFGQAHTAFKRMEELNEHYNLFMRHSLLVFVDEVQTKALLNERGVMAKLKNFITETYVTIRAMHQNGIEARNYTNWIFNSNMPDPVSIDKADRRFNVGKYQSLPLKGTVFSEKELEQLDAKLEKELMSFFSYLLFYPMDETKAHTVIDTDDRATMISISESAVDTCASAILEGNFEWLMDQLPTTTFPDRIRQLVLEDYKLTLASLIQRTDAKTGKCNISRDELRSIFEYTVGSMPNTPNKFTSLLKHHRIHMTKVWGMREPGVPGTVNGISTHWKDISGFQGYLTTLMPHNVTPITAAVKKAKTA